MLSKVKVFPWNEMSFSTCIVSLRPDLILRYGEIADSCHFRDKWNQFENHSKHVISMYYMRVLHELVYRVDAP